LGLFSWRFGCLFRSLLGPTWPVPGPKAPKPVSPPPWPLRAPEVWFWSVFGRFWVVFRPLFRCFSPLSARRAESASGAPVGPSGPQGPHPVLASFWLRFRVFLGTFFSAFGRDMGLWSLFPAFGRKSPFGGPKMGPFWAVLALFSGLRPENTGFRLYSKVGFGPPVGPCFRLVFGCFSGVFGCPGFARAKTRSGAPLAPVSRPVFGPFWPFLALFGALRAPPACFRLYSKVVWGPLGPFFGPLSGPFGADQKAPSRGLPWLPGAPNVPLLACFGALKGPKRPGTPNQVAFCPVFGLFLLRKNRPKTGQNAT